MRKSRSRRRGHTLRRLLGRTGVAVGVALFAGGVGFAWFLGRILVPTPPPQPAAGIVVLTGGTGRLKEAFGLLLAGAAPRLLVSGVGPETDLADLARLSDTPDASLVGRVRLGRHAATTEGNAKEARRWAREMHLNSLILVTSFYHMPRALVDFRKALPDVRLEPVSVPPASPLIGWPPHLWRVVVHEYAKWLLTEIIVAPLADAEQSRLKV
ncbi:MAG: YdcF family protein [Acetobacteraceae bacterium]